MAGPNPICRLLPEIKIRVTYLIALICGIQFLFSCMPSLPEKGIPDSGTYKRKLDMTVQGARRSYLIHIPENYKDKNPLPLLLILHGAFSTAEEMEEHTGFSALADKENFLAVYPNGAYGILGFLQHWNAGHCCGKAASDNLDDVGFLDSVITDVKNRFNIEENRIYMTGFSNGGMMTYRFAAERTGVLAAAAPLAASPGGKASKEDSLWIVPRPDRPLPIIMFHGLADGSVPYDGGVSPDKGGERAYLSVEKSIQFWLRNNQIDAQSQTTKLHGDYVKKEVWPGNAPVVLYAIKDWAHRWPGPFFTNKLDKNHPLHGFDAASIIWEFFKEHKRESRADR